MWNKYMPLNRGCPQKSPPRRLNSVAEHHKNNQKALHGIPIRIPCSRAMQHRSLHAPHYSRPAYFANFKQNGLEVRGIL